MIDVKKILIIEDDVKIASFMELSLKTQDYDVEIEKTGKAGILAFCNSMPDIILLDLGLPDMEGIDIIQEIRKVSEVPIIVVSAREFEKDKIAALDAGANDYVTKPFSMGELSARIRVAERYLLKASPAAEEKVLKFDDLIIDTERRIITLKQQEIHLTPLEYKLLLYLAKNSGKVVTHNQILKEVWGYMDEDAAKNIRVCMAGLRRKIEPDSTHPHYIMTEIGVGYRFAQQTR
ncbi:MAG: response regulator transcription factor [Lachnospiraceae bacterium]|nr:response regulator transcription factor [Lachnospiraceae bacterium]